MKAKKAIKRLDKVDQLLSNVIDQYVMREPDTREWLGSARKSVVRAKASLKKEASAKKAKNSAVNSGKKAAPVAAKVPSNGAKRKGANLETVQAARKTA